MRYHHDAFTSTGAPMRTTLDIEDDVLAAAKEMASRQRLSAGQLISRLLREAMSGSQRAGQADGGEARAVAGFLPFASQGVLITNAQIDALRDAEGV
jgi:hypothetical protein